MSIFLNEDEIDEAALRFRSHPVLGQATRFLAAYRDEVNAKSDGWPYWGHKAAGSLMRIVHQANPRTPNSREPTAAEVRKAIAPIKAFCTKRGLACPALGKAA